MTSQYKISYQASLWIILASIMLVRLMFLGAYPLADTTEARYGEMGRLMVETGDWITPQFEKGVPFWGKPPLSFWFTAISFKLFGIHEFSGRLPSFVLGLAVIAMVFSLGRYQAEPGKALTACVIMASSLIFWISSGAVMTDHCLLAGTTLSMVAFWRCVTANKDAGGRIWGWLFFTGLAAGLMAKGPVAILLTGVPVLSWALVRNKISLLLKLPWITGTCLTALLVLPWYIAAELKTPGFLEYFIIGEHWNRFLVPGWEGDLYGSAHSRPMGMIWCFWMACAFPWSVYLPFMFMKKARRRALKEKIRISMDWSAYLIFWAVAPMVIFTLAGNILWTYVLPGIPAFALFSSEVIPLKSRVGKGVRKVSGALLALMLLVSFAASLGIGSDDYSQKKMITYFNGINNGGKLYYLFWRPFSAEFYSGGTAGEIPFVSEIEKLYKDGQKDYLAVKDDRVSAIPSDIRLKFRKIKEVNGYVLFQEI